MKKIVALILVGLSVVSLFSITVVAVEPRWNNAASAFVALTINESGKATITYNCAGINGITTSISSETKLERKWGLFWLDVDGAEWTASVNGILLTKSHTVQLSKTGTYRATTKFSVSGTGGSNDSIKVTDKAAY